MHTPDHFPEEKQPEQNIELASQPFYEFSAQNSNAEEQSIATNENKVPLQPDTLSSEQRSSSQSQQSPPEDLIRQGLVYPPPPSFYQGNAQPAPSTPSLPVAGPFPPPPAGYVPQQGTSVPPFAPLPPPQRKKSYRWIWITASILGVLLIASCSFCGWAFYNFFASTVGPTTDTLTIANKYYAALQGKDYATAYGLIEPQGPLKGMTLDTFTQRAQNADEQYGGVRSYTANLGNFSTNSGKSLDLSRFTVIVSVSRMNSSYNTLLTLQRSGNSWKILDFDRI